PSWEHLAPGTDPAGTDPAATGTAATAGQSQGVVLIDTTLTDGEAAGTGLVIDAAGLVITNYHVVEGSTSVAVTVATDGTTYDAEVVGFDATADVALLQLEDAAGLAVVDVDDDGDPAVSDAVTAVGNAEGGGSLLASSGTVVALDQTITTATTAVSEGAELTGLIQTDAYVVGGYSGGALLDEEGEVVGITTAASQGGPTESYAVPIEDALAVADQIAAGEESADVQVGPAAYLGVGVVDTGAGVRVGSVEAGTAAADAGLEVGDLLTAVGGARVTSLDTLRAALAAWEPRDRVTLRWTDAAGTRHRASVTLGESPVA
ncbi:MAG TPA: trypsin-like peptidase domain-containing protein, partial [Nocardioides sp.]|nr:trypsin-like peptidase domain-containing protein [Nocardioides sp.]